MSTAKKAYQNKRVRIWLIQTDFTFRRLAFLLGISKSALHFYLSGQRPLPPNIRARLVNEFGFPSELLPLDERGTKVA
ncbi:MAG TPA: hypothetical protein VFE62_07950 [Gemmataceae bacterium]|nr:hypothetical protein [Gemmataceae bacterium]